MVKISVDFDMAGFGYDPQYPTRETEALCYKLNAIMDKMKDEGYEIRAIEPTDITDSEVYVTSLFNAVVTPPEEPVLVETPTNTDMLLDGSVYSQIMSARVAWLESSLNRLRAMVGANPQTDVGLYLKKIEELMRLELNKETVVYLSDGTPIFMRSGLIA